MDDVGFVWPKRRAASKKFYSSGLSSALASGRRDEGISESKAVPKCEMFWKAYDEVLSAVG